jgi:hypothetical protein
LWNTLCEAKSVPVAGLDVKGKTLKIQYQTAWIEYWKFQEDGTFYIWIADRPETPYWRGRWSGKNTISITDIKAGEATMPDVTITFYSKLRGELFNAPFKVIECYKK